MSLPSFAYFWSSVGNLSLAYCYYTSSKHFTFLNCLKIILTVHQRKCISQERSLAEAQELRGCSYSSLWFGQRPSWCFCIGLNPSNDSNTSAGRAMGGLQGCDKHSSADCLEVLYGNAEGSGASCSKGLLPSTAGVPLPSGALLKRQVNKERDYSTDRQLSRAMQM